MRLIGMAGVVAAALSLAISSRAQTPDARPILDVHVSISEESPSSGCSITFALFNNSVEYLRSVHVVFEVRHGYDQDLRTVLFEEIAEGRVRSVTRLLDRHCTALNHVSVVRVLSCIGENVRFDNCGAIIGGRYYRPDMTARFFGPAQRE